MQTLILIKAYTILGWTGTLAYLAAYFLLSINKLKSHQVSYHFLNILGAFGLVTNALHYSDLPNIVVNIAWGVIALVAIIVLRFKTVKKS